MAAYDLAGSVDRARQSVSDSLYDHSMRWWDDSWVNATYNLAAADMANAHELDMWNLQNQYNTPSAQMQRFKDAGLNPMLIYQQGSPGNASSAPGTHTPNFDIHPQQDKMAKIQTALQMFNTFSQVLGQAFGVTEQAMDIGIKRNELSMSNWNNAVAQGSLLGYGQGRNAKQFGILGGVENGLNPLDPNFDAAKFSLLNRLGLTGYYPKQLTAETNAEYTSARTDYQNWYNEKYAPLVESYLQGKIDLQEFQKRQNEYQTEVLETLPPWMRALVVPIFDYIRPFINSLLRR